MDQRAGLVEEEGCERDAELGWDDREAALLPLVLCVELRDLFSSLLVRGLFAQLLPHQWDVPVFEWLAEVRRLICLVHVDLAELFDRHAELVGDFFHVRLGDEHTLRPTEASEGSVRYCVGLADASTHVDIRDSVSVVDVAQGSVHHGGTQILRPTTVVENVTVKCLQFAVLVDCHLPSCEERMTLSRGQDVVVSVEHATHRSLHLLRRNSADSSKLDTPGLLSTKTTTQPLYLRDNLVGRNTGHLGDISLSFGRVLGGSPDFHLAVFGLGNSNTGIGFQVEVLLSTHASNTLEDVVSFLESLLRVTIDDVVVVREERFFLDRLFHCEDGRQLLVLDPHSSCAGLRELGRSRKDHSDGLARGEYFVQREECLITVWCAPPVGLWGRNISVVDV